MILLAAAALANQRNGTQNATLRHLLSTDAPAPNVDMEGDAGLLTFVVPCSGRTSLFDLTIPSLSAQISQRWRALLVFDGGIHDEAFAARIGAAADLEPRLRVWVLSKRMGFFATGGAMRGHGSAGSVRNLAFQHVATPWVGFVDDDDSVSPKYVSLVEQALTEGERVGQHWDSITFRMRWAPWRAFQEPFCHGYGCNQQDRNGSLSEVLPEWNATFLQRGHCGISFCLRTNLTRQGFRFEHQDHPVRGLPYCTAL